jgi:hypothetical protein
MVEKNGSVGHAILYEGCDENIKAFTWTYAKQMENCKMKKITYLPILITLCTTLNSTAYAEPEYMNNDYGSDYYTGSDANYASDSDSYYPTYSGSERDSNTYYENNRRYRHNRKIERDESRDENRYESRDERRNESREERREKNRGHFAQTRPATGNHVFIFSPRAHAWAAYDGSGQLIRTGRASGGKAYCPDVRRACRTIVGTFHVIYKGGPDCISNIYPIKTGGGAPMPYCMRFSPKGYAIHGSNSVPNYNASHGCIRVPPADARWLSQNFVRYGTTVIVQPY